jgi:amino acid adenylation domain-containing protein
MLWSAAARSPAKAAIVERERTVSYEELRGRAGAVARALTLAAVQPGDRVVIHLERGVDAVAAYFGVLATGALAVVVNEMLRPRQVEYVLGQSGAKALLTSAAMQARVHRDVSTRAVTITTDALEAAAEYEPRPCGAESPAQITYTSGSTGLPKGVVGSHGNVWAVIGAVAAYLGLSERDRIAGLLPISGVYGANQMLCSVMTSATLVIPKSPLMNEVAAELRESAATVLAAVPPLWLQLLQAPGFTSEPLPSLRILQNAGGHLAPAAVRQLRVVQPQADVFLQYGMTEVFRTSFLPPQDVDSRPDSMGRPMADAEVLIVRDDGTLCDVGEVGELVHSGPTVTLGYWNDPERTAEVYRAHPVHGEARRAVYSGDMVRRDADGYLYFVSRRDRMIKTLGYRVGPDEILDVLYASKQIREGIVTSEEDRDRGQRIVAYVVLQPEGTTHELKKFCKAELPRYMQPAEIRELEELPRLPNGKHDLAALQQRATASVPA